MQPEAYTQMAEAERAHWWFVGRRRLLEAVITALALPPAARILEVGSGTGGNFPLLQRFGAVTAIELNETARAMATARTGLPVQSGALPDALGLGDQKFDLICLFDVLEHVGPDAASLQALRAHLAPGGRLILTVPAYRALFGPHDKALHHFRRYERAALAALLGQTGYAIHYLTFFNCLLLPLALMARLADRLFRREAPLGERTPAAPLNAVLTAIFSAEAGPLSRRRRLPFGLSLLAVAVAAG
jgi:SAM-dependent methyltransferase